MKDRKLFVKRLIMTLLCVAAVISIFSRSAMSAEASTEESNPFVEGINAFLSSIGLSLTVTEKFVRKLAHFTEYAALGALLSVTVSLYISKRLRVFLTTLAIGLGIAVCDELIQLFPSGRSCEVKDMLIDFSGVAFAALIIQGIWSLILRHRRKKEGNENERSRA